MARRPLAHCVLFSGPVENPNGRQRGITDRRPQNAMDHALPRSTLPHACLLNLVVLPPSERLVAHLRDLSNFFPSLRVPREKAMRDVIDAPLCPREALEAWTQIPLHLQ